MADLSGNLPVIPDPIGDLHKIIPSASSLQETDETFSKPSSTASKGVCSPWYIYLLNNLIPIHTHITKPMAIVITDASGPKSPPVNSSGPEVKDSSIL